jgi:hypothetical protein
MSGVSGWRLAVGGWEHQRSRGDREPDDWLGGHFQVSGLGNQEPATGNQVQVRGPGPGAEHLDRVAEGRGLLTESHPTLCRDFVRVLIFTNR